MLYRQIFLTTGSSNPRADKGVQGPITLTDREITPGFSNSAWCSVFVERHTEDDFI